MFENLEKQQYINLETFRKNGVGMRTPVWFVLKGDTIFVRTVDNSGKVKRVRNNGTVNVAPCKADGALLGEWQAAQAREVTGDEVNRVVDMLLDKKYGLMKKLFALSSRIQGRGYTVLEVKLG